MLCLHYQDEQDRARAVAAVVERCRYLGLRVAFLGSEAACESTRVALLDFGGAVSTRVTFHCLTWSRSELGSERRCAEAVDLIRAELREIVASGTPTVAWVEAPVGRDGRASGASLRAYNEAIESVAAASPTTAICAWRLGDLSDLASLVGGRNALINASMLLPECPTWVVRRSSSDVLPIVDVSRRPEPQRTLASDPVFTPLFHAEKLAALGQLAAGVAHELGNPLSIISSSLQYLQQRLAAADDPAADFAMTALKNVDRMHGLLRSMLDFGAVRQRQVEPVDLKEAISEVLRFTSGECGRGGLLVEVSFDPSLPPVRADPGGIKQILLNLVKNALDALSEEGQLLRVCTRLRVPDHCAIIDVENDGPTISSEILPNLFRPFYTTKAGGTGLGLYLSREIARDHGGDLVAENLPRGIRFSLTLPLGRSLGDMHAPHTHRR